MAVEAGAYKKMQNRQQDQKMSELKTKPTKHKITFHVSLVLPDTISTKLMCEIIKEGLTYWFSKNSLGIHGIQIKVALSPQFQDKKLSIYFKKRKASE